jgi:hypothetical protein
METKKFEFEGNEITFLTGDNIMVNATEMARPFEVSPNSWLRTDKAIAAIHEYSCTHNCEHEDLVVTRMGTSNVGGGTWLHHKLAMMFAQWLSLKFYFWCNDRIEELFKYGITALREEDRKILFTLSEVAVKIMSNYPYKVGRNKVYEGLRQRGLLNEHNKPLQKWIDRGLFEYRLYRDDEYRKYPVATEEGLKYIFQLLFPQAPTNPKLESKMDLALNGIEVLLDNILISKAGSINAPEQSKMVVERMRDISAKIKEIREDNSPVLDVPINPVQLKLDRY